MNNNTTVTCDNNRPDKTYAGLLNLGQAQDYALYRHSRARFLQQSALYLGADLNDSKVLSLCFSDNVIHR
jgi:hypothetical protein